MDANSYALQVQPASKSLGVVIRSAIWLGKGKQKAITTSSEPQQENIPTKTADKNENKTKPLALETKTALESELKDKPIFSLVADGQGCTGTVKTDNEESLPTTPIPDPTGLISCNYLLNDPDAYFNCLLSELPFDKFINETIEDCKEFAACTVECTAAWAGIKASEHVAENALEKAGKIVSNLSIKTATKILR